MDDTLQSVVEVVRRRCRNGEVEDRITDPNVELRELGFSSLDVVGLILELESSLGFKFPAEMIKREVMHSLQTLADSIDPLLEPPKE